MNYYFEKCCFDYELVRKTYQCDRVTCQGNHDPEFSVYFLKVNNESCYCLNRKQLRQYWCCIVQDREKLCPMSCSRCEICKEVSHVFSELKDTYFLHPKHIYVIILTFLFNHFFGEFLVQKLKYRFR